MSNKGRLRTKIEPPTADEAVGRVLQIKTTYSSLCFTVEHIAKKGSRCVLMATLRSHQTNLTHEESWLAIKQNIWDGYIAVVASEPDVVSVIRSLSELEDYCGA